MEQYLLKINTQRMRQAFLNQYGQSLIVDLNNFQLDFLKNVIEALKHILALGCSIRGGNRIPVFELTILTSRFTKIFELDVIRGNFKKILSGLNSLPNYCNINENISTQDYKDYLFLSIKSAIQTFKLKQEQNNWKLNIPKLEITIITSKNGETVRTEIESFIENIDVCKIHKIKIIEVQNTKESILKDLDIYEENPTFIQIFSISGHSYTNFKKYFKRWLLDRCQDIDAILNFPGPFQTNLKIKCDLHECVLNPLSLPFGHRFYLQVDSLTIQLNGSSVAAMSNIPIFEINIIARVNSSGICESSLFGLPHCLTPSRSLRLDLEEQNLNAQHFSELCRQLASDEKYLLARLIPHFQCDQFLPYFILIPGNCCLLIKSFASSDLTMPWKQNSVRKTISKESSTRIFTNLQNLEEIENMDEMNYDSGLLKNLVANLEHSKTQNSSNEDGEQSYSNKKARRSNNKT